MSVSEAELEPGEGVLLYPWQTPQLVWSELVQLFQGATSTSVVDFTLGSGTLALACAHEGVPYFGFAMNETHVSVANDVLLLMSVLDVVRGSPMSILPVKRSLKRLISDEHRLHGGRVEGDELRKSELNTPLQPLPKKRIVFFPDKKSGDGTSTIGTPDLGRDQGDYDEDDELLDGDGDGDGDEDDDGLKMMLA